jgi:LPS sulfotransferase NodH
MKYLVISQPKAGTYLAASLLESLGIMFSHVHIDPGMYRIFHNNDVSQYDKYSGDLKMAISAIPEDQFGVGHIAFDKENKKQLSDVKKIIVLRDIKDIQESAKRYAEEKGIDVESIVTSYNLEKIKEWSEEKDTFVISFEEMIGEDVDKINSLQHFLFEKIKTDSLWAIRQAKMADSLTKSSIR